MQMSDETFTGSPAEIARWVRDDLDWAETLTSGGDVSGTVTLNTDRTENPTTYFLVWHMDDGTVQTDIYTVATD